MDAITTSDDATLYPALQRLPMINTSIELSVVGQLCRHVGARDPHILADQYLNQGGGRGI